MQSKKPQPRPNTIRNATAIVSEEAGTTRDRHFGRVEWAGAHFWLVDTGGLVEDSNVPMDNEIRKQVMQAIDEAECCTQDRDEHDLEGPGDEDDRAGVGHLPVEEARGQHHHRWRQHGACDWRWIAAWRHARDQSVDCRTQGRAMRIAEEGVAGSAGQRRQRAGCRGAQTLLFAVKPQILRSVCEGLREVVQQRKPLIMSIAAGARIDDIDAWLGGGLRVVRVMPNQPALIDQGISALYANARTDPAGRIMAEKIMSAVGEVVWMDSESRMDAVTAVSGTGPAYFYLLIDVMIETAIKLGIDPATARTLAVETARGA
ncbi:MAG: hypothetical protein HC783_12420, partial [Rhodobacteraceae bacterium]|nr:hypothetical protein [Paracoccaceae bacterium]